ncbi:MAG: aspartate aminotransferase family protein, partial [Flavobacteriia bacterium]
GKLFGFEHYSVIPDILITGKGLGGGMPIGAFISSYKNMSLLKEHPKLGHITTFGGHPVISAAALATLEEITRSEIMNEIDEKEALFRKILVHKEILEIRGKGLMLALILKDKETADHLILEAINTGLLLFWLLFEPKAVRITPPLTISKEEIKRGCAIILDILDSL